jgi:hypothetical protein
VYFWLGHLWHESGYMLAKSEEESEEDDNTPSRGCRWCPDCSNNTGLLTHIWKQLLQDIECAGSIASNSSLKAIMILNEMSMVNQTCKSDAQYGTLLTNGNIFGLALITMHS